MGEDIISSTYVRLDERVKIWRGIVFHVTMVLIFKHGVKMCLYKLYMISRNCENKRVGSNFAILLCKQKQYVFLNQNSSIWTVTKVHRTVIYIIFREIYTNTRTLYIVYIYLGTSYVGIYTNILFFITGRLKIWSMLFECLDDEFFFRLKIPSIIIVNIINNNFLIAV